MSDTSPDISINTNNAHFFIAICKKGSHSFLMLGLHENYQVSHLLCRVGKFFDVGSEKPDCFSINKLLFEAIVSSSKGKIKDEGIYRKSKTKKLITYQAYDINYKQYREFIKLLEGLQTEDNQFECYKPFEKQGEEQGNQVVLKLTKDIVVTPRLNMEDLKEETGEVSVTNTCRHTAIQLAKDVRHAPVSSLVSSNFYSDLPYTTQLKNGVPTTDIPFYVLPVSPVAYPELSDEKRSILFKLYSRMEHLLLIDTHSEQTQNKFQCLKELYNEISGPQKELSLNQLLISIQAWKEVNTAKLNVLRVTYFWDSFFTRKSATSMLITEIEQDLQRAQQAQ